MQQPVADPEDEDDEEVKDEEQEEMEEEKKGDGDIENDSTAAETTANETATEAAPSEAPTEQEEEEKVEEFDEELPPIRMPIVDKAYEEVTRIIESFAWLNYQKNDTDYKATFGSEQEHFDWNSAFYQELLEFHAIQEFNELKGKQFVPLQQFSEVYRLVQSKPKANSIENTLP